MLIKQHKIAIKKVELCEAAPYYWGFAPDSFLQFKTTEEEEEEEETWSHYLLQLLHPH